jgi:glycosyltransferase involved in cell wall biosynthesis
LGRLDPKKGIENLFEACKILNFESPVGAGRQFLDWSLVVAGSGSDEYTEGLRSRVRALGLTERVEMVGQVRDERKEALFDETDILVVPSYTENFANVVVEALARGVPVLASTGTPWKRLEDFGCGLWVENKPETLAAAIMRMSEMRLDEMGEHARKWMEDEFSWTTIAEQMIALYGESLTRNAWSRGKTVNPTMVDRPPSL